MPELVDEGESQRDARVLVPLEAVDGEHEPRGPSGHQSARAVGAVRLDLLQPHLVPAVPVDAVEELGGGVRLDGAQIRGHGFVDGSVGHDLAVLEQDPALAERLDDRHVVADEDDGSPLVRHLAHLPDALALEADVADRQHLVDEHDLRIEVRGHREREPDGHAARVALERGVEEALDLGEVHDLVEAPVDLAPPHAEDRAVQIDVLAPGQLPVEAGPDLEQRAQPSLDACVPRRRLGDAREDLEQRALAGSVAPDERDEVAFRHLERHVAKSPERRAVVLADALAAGAAGPERPP